jgi:hypothetical protein
VRCGCKVGIEDVDGSEGSSEGGARDGGGASVWEIDDLLASRNIDEDEIRHL